jgi:transposase
VGASERDEFLRAAWQVMVAEGIDAGRFVCSWMSVAPTPRFLRCMPGRLTKGQRARSSVPRNWGKNITLLASITAEGMGPSLVVEGATTREMFEAYLERLLAPSLRPGQVVVMDNLSVHKGGRVRELIEGRGCELLYLPPYYSPDFNPIEEAFANVKTSH